MSDQEILQTFDHIFKEFVVSDLENAISAKANYLVALGIFTYIEFLGSIISGNGNIRGLSELNFNEALKYFSPDYAQIGEQMAVVDINGARQAGLYSIVRCGLVHNYLIKGGGIVFNNPDGNTSDHLGIEIIDYIDQHPKRYGVAVYNNELLRDFKNAINEVANQLNLKQEPLLSNVRKSLESLKSLTLCSTM